jgi:hypothetical protein
MHAHLTVDGRRTQRLVSTNEGELFVRLARHVVDPHGGARQLLKQRRLGQELVARAVTKYTRTPAFRASSATP